MLNNPFWNVSLDSFIAWLETKNPEEQYDFNDCKGECLTGQYMTHLGIPWNVISMGGVDHFPNYHLVMARLNCKYSIVVSGPWTYGAALKRARLAAKEA